jgi:predicted Zn finger-like uncharacterized protein
MVQPEPKSVVIVCPHCGTRYQLSAEAIGSGRLVQCASCMQSWQATLPGATSFTPPAPEDDRMFDEDAEAELDARFETEERRVNQIVPVRDVPPAPSEATPPPQVVASKPVAREAANDPATRQQQKEYTQRRKSMSRRLPIDKFRRIARLFGILILIAIVGGGVAFRTEIVRQVPDLAGLYQVLGLGVNVIGLEFRDMRTTRSLRDGVEVLSVEARIVGVSSRRVVVPPVVVTLLDANGRSVYEWSVTPDARDLEAGEAVAFDTSLTDPPEGADTVRLTFTNGRARTETPIAQSAEPLETSH